MSHKINKKLKKEWESKLGPKYRETIGNDPQIWRILDNASTSKAKTLDLLHKLYWELIEMGMPQWSPEDEARLFDLSNGSIGTTGKKSETNAYPVLNGTRLNSWIDKSLKSLLNEYEKRRAAISNEEGVTHLNKKILPAQEKK